MKRGAAIVGPTPPFIRWALDFPCPLLRPALGRSATLEKNRAQAHWRQVRGFQEISRGKLQGRTHAGFCFAPQSTAQQVLAVRIDEVTAAWGGSVSIEAACSSCPANPTPSRDVWAACTGLLPLVPPAASLEETRALWRQRRQTIETFAAELNPSRQPSRWTEIWAGPYLSAESLTLAAGILQRCRELLAEQPVEAEALLAALEHAARTEQRIWIEPVPSGYSDGESWSLPAHCLVCGEEWPLTKPGGSCPECHRAATYQAARRLKVLGLSPYLRLAEVVGNEAARDLQAQYALSKQASAEGD
jgi:hypothetical protein